MLNWVCLYYFVACVFNVGVSLNALVTHFYPGDFWLQLTSTEFWLQLSDVELLKDSWSVVPWLPFYQVETNQSEFLLFLLRDVQLNLAMAGLFLLNWLWHFFRHIWALRFTLLLLFLFPAVMAIELTYSHFDNDSSFMDLHLRHIIGLVGSFIIAITLLAYLLMSPDIQRRYNPDVN